MGGASRLVMLLTAPFPTILRRQPLHRRLFTATPNHPRLRRFLLPLKSSSSSYHSQPLSAAVGTTTTTANNNNNNHSEVSAISASHPWPEWSHLINTLITTSSTQEGERFSAAEEHGILPEDAFVVYEEKQLSPDFVKAASALLAFAHHRPNLLRELLRRDIEVVVSNGTPFLFETALATGRRMRAFLGGEGANVSETDKASTVDLMKYILSYASNPAVPSERSTIYSRELVETSVRNLLHELVQVSCASPAPDQLDGGEHQFPGRYGQTPRPLNQNIVMKRGDWICSKCNFMNFARNYNCLECEGPRPKRQLVGGEWECPQCDFFNYGRNAVCLKCDCKRPGPDPISPLNSVSAPGYNGDYAYKTNTDSRLAENEEKAQRWFSKLDSSDLSSAATDEDFPEIMPLRKGQNKFVVSTRKTPLERRLANAPQGKVSQVGDAGNNPDTSIRRSLDQILGRSSSNKNHKSEMEGSESSSQTNSIPLKNEAQMDDNFQLSGGLESQPNSINEEKEQADKSERWFKRMAELHDVKDLPSAVSDEDFPEIMPMRKGENRFVVSKKKDRSLTSPAYKRQVAMEQPSANKYVPFVPFPPGYFARKDSQPQAGSDSSVKATDQVPTDPRANDVNAMCKTDNQQETAVGNSLSWDNRAPPHRGYEQNSFPHAASNVDEGNTAPPKNYTEGGFPNQNPWKEAKAQSLDLAGNSTSKTSGARNTSHSASPSGASQDTASQSIRSGWTGKSLEGSAVKEPDPLDMSEEAKAERWFRRVAQIKDISELSQIPDEDFPSIMPMRKGVNRFVVSKRKTPLERRLTSPQYRRNLPVVSSDPLKNNDNDNSEGK